MIPSPTFIITHLSPETSACSESHALSLAQKVPSDFPGFGNSNTILPCYFGSKASNMSVWLIFVIWNAHCWFISTSTVLDHILISSHIIYQSSINPLPAYDPPVSHIKTKVCLTVFLWAHRSHSMCELYGAMLQEVPLHTEYMTIAYNNAVTSSQKLAIT